MVSGVSNEASALDYKFEMKPFTVIQCSWS